MQPATHLSISPALCGVPSDLGEGTATVTLTTTPQLAADDRGLVHGGFVFGQADYAAMLAVNDPNVVLGGADCRFLAPVAVGQRMTAVAVVDEVKGRKRGVEVTVTVGDRKVFTGRFTCFVLDQHVLDG
jgi:acyl-coenzyme A thioesterase PaaI-like protein